MRKELTLLLGTLFLTGCDFLNPGGCWTEQQTENMISFATQRFNEVKEIVNKYDGKITNEYNGGRDKFIVYDCHHYAHNNSIDFTIQNISYDLIIDLVPNEMDEPEVHVIYLDVRSSKFANPDDCVFEEEQYAVMNDLLEYLDYYVSAKSFISLDQIADYLDVAKENYTDEIHGGAYEDKQTDKESMVYYSGSFAFIKKTDYEFYYNAFYLEFFKCPDKFN